MIEDNYKFILVYEKNNINKDCFDLYSEDEDNSSDDVHERIMDDISSEPYTLYRIKDSDYTKLLNKIMEISKGELIWKESRFW